MSVRKLCSLKQTQLVSYLFEYIKVVLETKKKNKGK